MFAGLRCQPGSLSDHMVILKNLDIIEMMDLLEAKGLLGHGHMVSQVSV